MRVLSKEDLEKERTKLVRNLRNCLFIYPTDTVYGIGCNAEERKLVRKLRSLKEQFDRPLSVIVPSKKWIRENCEVNDLVEKWLEKLPGPYTFILNLKKTDSVSRLIHLNKNTIGVRIPRHWISYIVEDMGVPVVTTSANITGKEVMTNLDDLNKKLKEGVDYIIFDEEIIGKSSTIVNLSQGKEEILRS